MYLSLSSLLYDYMYNLAPFCFEAISLFLCVLTWNVCSLLAVRELDVPGEIYERKTYPFEFATVEMPYESYNGTNVRLR